MWVGDKGIYFYQGFTFTRLQWNLAVFKVYKKREQKKIHTVSIVAFSLFSLSVPAPIASQPSQWWLCRSRCMRLRLPYKNDRKLVCLLSSEIEREREEKQKRREEGILSLIVAGCSNVLLYWWSFVICLLLLSSLAHSLTHSTDFFHHLLMD